MQFDKRISIATGINLIQLIAVVWFGASFYTQVNANQVKNDDRFTQFTEERKLQNDQMMKLQEAQSALLLQVTSMGVDTNNLGKGVDEIRDTLRKPR